MRIDQQRRRSGALRPIDVDAVTVNLLSTGNLETANFAEQFAIDLVRLLRQRLPLNVSSDRLRAPMKQRLFAAATALAEAVPPATIWDRVSAECDTIRAIGAIAVAKAERSPADRLAMLMPFADDPHFAVREWAWIGLREELRGGLLTLIPELVDMAESDRPSIRRFASEITRPRGVWTPHLIELKERPERGLDVIDKLRSDESRYVRLSVGNWLNDASKDAPIWVRRLCDSWLSMNDATHWTTEVCRRGLRTLNQPGASTS